mmetsp:Transcript_30016/g.45227  ORF Transcript_30016/g.45227 Transcript_30016/m.45227 type:complete len:172 (-) Transcript_30016:91-606(-)|eukprot:CAMPEP_0194760344 /NCGR_PEP_ID=MMETSP0323_2-20130528/13270_1 /TAXON_ID=2866 ORGANISM="Crypthecodinium cohnii, Strain Seligo" /NCGR_SAMPLE_ID=MMETSP0323_2 /ASSEMBLY_ACC=CAM_ASM_000346 /LENGTH=171 /DNA_ID=CAMNT_0039681571 /DNA_START=35 /DNA_END=550 /DNA_ORIENTATION=+
MPLIGLFMKAQLENIEKIEFPVNTDWTVDVSAGNGIDTRERVTINAQDEVDIPNSKGTCNFTVKFEGSKQPATISVVTLSRKVEAKELKGQTLGEYSGSGLKPIAVFDCRGAEPTKWYPVGPFKVTASDSSKAFDDVDLSDALEDGWCEYDDEKDQPVGITELSFEFKTVK